MKTIKTDSGEFKANVMLIEDGKTINVLMQACFEGGKFFFNKEYPLTAEGEDARVHQTACLIEALENEAKDQFSRMQKENKDPFFALLKKMGY